MYSPNMLLVAALMVEMLLCRLARAPKEGAGPPRVTFRPAELASIAGELERAACAVLCVFAVLGKWARRGNTDLAEEAGRGAGGGAR